MKFTVPPCLSHPLAVLSAAIFAPVLSASPLFEQQTPNLWLLESSGEFSAHRIDANPHWLSNFSPAGEPLYPLASGQQALINTLAASSQALSANQPAISIAGLGTPEKVDGDTSPQVLALQPRGGAFTRSTVVELRINKAQVDGNNYQLILNHNSRSTAVTLDQAHLQRLAQNAGFYTQTLTLVADGAHSVSVSLRNGTSAVASASGAYQINANHPDGVRRDSDGDGLPDLVEAAIGLDVYDNNWQRDSDNNGWSDFDEWLRRDSLDPSGVPLDSDGDGWSDFDENLRGTNPADQPVIVSEDIVGEEPRRRAARRFQHVPVARRLYEVEYRLNGSLDNAELTQLIAQLSTAQQSALGFADVQAFSLSGIHLWAQQNLVSEAEIGALGLNPDLIHASKKLSTARDFLSENSLPLLRLPASQTQVLSADFAVPSDQGKRLFRYKSLLAPSADLTPLAFQASLAAGNSASWQTAEQWRQAYIGFLSANLVEARNIELNRSSTIDIALLEGFLSLESELQQQAPLVRMNSNDHLGADLAAQIELALGNLSRLAQAGGAYSLLQLQRQLAANDNAQMTALREFWAQRWAQLPGGVASDVYLQQLLATSDDPAYGYQLRLAALPGVNAAAQTDLYQVDADSDGDGLSNGDEVLSLAGRLSLPWRGDTDGDSLVDGSDNCPLDELNACDGTADLPSLIVDSSISVSEPGEGGEAYALVSIRLDRVYQQDVVLDFQALSAAGDSAVAGEDYSAVSGQLVIAPGQRVALVRIPILGDNSDESGEQFRLQISNVQGANFDGGQTLIAINEQVVEPPRALLASNALSIDERATGILDASLSSDPAGLALTYRWQVLDAAGLNLTLAQADQVQASLTAPELLSPTSVVLRLTVSNSANLSDSADLTVTINPIDDAPQVIGTPRFSVTPGTALSISDSELLSYVRELEGQPMALGAVVQAPSLGSLTREADGFSFLYNASALNPVSGPWGRNAVEVDGDYLLFVEHDSDNGVITNSRVVSYRFSTASKTTLYSYNSGDQLAEFYLAEGQSPVYFQVDNRLFSWRSNGGLQDVAFGLGKQPLFVDPNSGNALICDADGSEAWYLLNGVDLSLNQTQLTCSTGDSARVAKLGSGFCVAYDLRTTCVDSNNVVSQVASLESGFYSGLLGLAPGNNEGKSLLAVNQRSSAPSGDQSFGFRVAVDGDWAAVGATTANNFAGKAMVYKRSAGTWLLHQTLEYANSSSFGQSVHLTAGRLVVSAYGGQVVSYELENDLWQQQQVLTPQANGISQGFGRAVDMSSDGSLLAITTGVGNSDDALELYRWQSDQWQHFQTLNPSDLSGFDDFGLRASIENQRLIASTPRIDNDGSNHKGRVWVYDFDNGSYRLEGSIAPPQSVAGTIFSFGDDLDLSLDSTRLVVGAGTNSYGSAFVYEWINAQWQLASELRNPINGADNNFGRAVLLAGDTAYVSGPTRDSFDALDALVAGFTRNANGDWPHNGQILRGAAAVADYFGGDIAYDGNTMVVGAYNRDDDGAVDIFSRDGNELGKVAALLAPDDVSVEFALYTLSREPSLEAQELWSTASNSAVTPQLQALSSGGALIVGSDTNRVTLWGWNGFNQDVLDIASRDIASGVSEEQAIGELLELDGQYYWLAQTSATQKTLARFDNANATLNASLAFDSAPDNRSALKRYNGHLYLLSGGSTAGLCRWQRLDTALGLVLVGGSAGELVDGVLCQPAFGNNTADAIVFNTLSALGFSQYQALAAQSGAGQTSFVLSVSDDTNNSTELTVELQWQ